MNKISEIFSFKKFNSSGLFVGVLIGLFAAYGFQHIPFSNKLAASALVSTANGSASVCGLTQMPFNDNVYGLTVSELDFNTLTAAYQVAHPITELGVTWGGVIGKKHLIAVINSLGNDATYINFKFITNLENKKTSIIFQGGTFNAVSGDPGTSKLFMRTGYAADAFCPTRCQ